ncbi:MAG: FadR/GntR family transcriptional regulator [Thermomicrobiales bacterium]
MENAEAGSTTRSATPRDEASVPRPDLSAHIAGRLIEHIQQGNLNPGDRLPSTRELATRYSVALPTVREAIRRLQATGIVDARHGSGTYVSRTHNRFMVTNPHLGVVQGRLILDLLDARLLIEPHLAAMAAQHANEQQVELMQTLLEESAGHIQNGRDDLLLQSNMAFHAAVARGSGNQILADMIQSLVEVYASEQFTVLSLYNARSEDHVEHLQIMSAIHEQQDQRARELMFAHMHGVKAIVEAKLAERSPIALPVR